MAGIFRQSISQRGFNSSRVSAWDLLALRLPVLQEFACVGLSPRPLCYSSWVSWSHGLSRQLLTSLACERLRCIFGSHPALLLLLASSRRLARNSSRSMGPRSIASSSSSSSTLPSPDLDRTLRRLPTKHLGSCLTLLSWSWCLIRCSTRSACRSWPQSLDLESWLACSCILAWEASWKLEGRCALRGEKWWWRWEAGVKFVGGWCLEGCLVPLNVGSFRAVITVLYQAKGKVGLIQI